MKTRHWKQDPIRVTVFDEQGVFVAHRDLVNEIATRGQYRTLCRVADADGKLYDEYISNYQLPITGELKKW